MYMIEDNCQFPRIIKIDRDEFLRRYGDDRYAEFDDDARYRIALGRDVSPILFETVHDAAVELVDLIKNSIDTVDIACVLSVQRDSALNAIISELLRRGIQIPSSADIQSERDRIQYAETERAHELERLERRRNSEHPELQPEVINAISQLIASPDSVEFDGVVYRAARTLDGSIKIDRALNDAVARHGLVGREIGAVYSAAQRLVHKAAIGR